VERFSAKRRNVPCHSLTQWRHYYTKYHTIAGGPLTKGHLSREDYNVYFLIGIHRPLQQVIENHILQSNPFRGDIDQYTVKEIDDAAESYFRRNKYESLMVRAADLGGELEEESAEETSDDSSDSDISESDYEDFQWKRKQQAQKKRQEKKRETSKKKIGERGMQQYQGKEEEITSMICKLSTM
jgi:hypothetical protein